MLSQFFREHKLAIFFAVLTSVIIAAPQVYFRLEHRNDGVYQGIELLPDAPRSALVREVQDGHPGMGSVYYKDGKSDPYLYQPLQPMVVGYMGKIFSLDINNTILLSRLVLPFFVFLLIYIFIFLFSGDKLAALSASAVLSLADSVTTISGLSRLLHGVSPDNFLRLARPVNPAMIFIPFLAFLIVFWLFYRKRDWRFGLASAILLGLNFYNYFYSWSFLYSFGGVLVLIFLLQKKWHEALRLSSVFFGALVLGIPYFMNLYRASLYPTFTEVGQRFGLVLSHAPIFVGFAVVGAVIVFLFGFPRADKEKYFFGLALLLTGFVVHNQQILTGRIMQVDHYHWFFNRPMAIMLVFVVIFHWLTHSRLVQYKKAIATLIIVGSVFTGIFTQTVSYAFDRRDGGQIAIERQKYGPVMRWLSENGEKEAVVLANDEASQITTIYTPLNVFYHRAAVLSLSATKTRLLDVLFTFYRLRGVGEKKAEEALSAERDFISGNVYGIYYRELLDTYEAMPDEKFDEIVDLYKGTLSVPTERWLKDIFTQYEVEYLVWDTKKDPSWQLGKYPFLEEAAVFGDMAIYRFSQN